jgi:hypothetical protein
LGEREKGEKGRKGEREGRKERKRREKREREKERKEKGRGRKGGRKGEKRKGGRKGERDKRRKENCGRGSKTIIYRERAGQSSNAKALKKNKIADFFSALLRRVFFIQGLEPEKIFNKSEIAQRR